MTDLESKNTMMPFNGDFYGSDGKIRNLDEFIAALLGGTTGNGAPGKSAYEIAVERGFVGTVDEWLAGLKGKDGDNNGGGLFKSVLTFDDLPKPATDYLNELYFVRESTGGALAFMGVYKYPRGFYSVNEDDEWAHVPLDLSVAEDAFTVANITDWTGFKEFVKKVNIGDIVLYDGVLYKNKTGIFTDDAPIDDAVNWSVFRIDLSAEPLRENEIGDNAVTDNKIGNRALDDEAGSGTLITAAGKKLTAWLQGVRNNLKWLFENKLNTDAKAADSAKFNGKTPDEFIEGLSFMHGVGWWGWNTAANLADISSVPGSKAGDYFVNTGTATRAMLGVNIAVGGIIRSTSATAGTAAGNIRGAAGANAADYTEWINLFKSQNGNVINFQADSSRGMPAMRIASQVHAGNGNNPLPSHLGTGLALGAQGTQSGEAPNFIYLGADRVFLRDGTEVNGGDGSGVRVVDMNYVNVDNHGNYAEVYRDNGFDPKSMYILGIYYSSPAGYIYQDIIVDPYTDNGNWREYLFQLSNSGNTIYFETCMGDDGIIYVNCDRHLYSMASFSLYKITEIKGGRGEFRRLEFWDETISAHNSHYFHLGWDEVKIVSIHIEGYSDRRGEFSNVIPYITSKQNYSVSGSMGTNGRELLGYEFWLDSDQDGWHLGSCFEDGHGNNIHIYNITVFYE